MTGVWADRISSGCLLGASGGSGLDSDSSCSRDSQGFWPQTAKPELQVCEERGQLGKQTLLVLWEWPDVCLAGQLVTSKSITAHHLYQQTVVGAHSRGTLGADEPDSQMLKYILGISSDVWGAEVRPGWIKICPWCKQWWEGAQMRAGKKQEHNSHCQKYRSQLSGVEPDGLCWGKGMERNGDN